MELILRETIDTLGEEGDIVKVKVIGIDGQGRINLSMKSVDQDKENS